MELNVFLEIVSLGVFLNESVKEVQGNIAMQHKSVRAGTDSGQENSDLSNILPHSHFEEEFLD